MLAAASTAANHFQSLVQDYDSRHRELLQKHVNGQYSRLNRQYQSSYERMSIRIKERHRQLLETSSQYLKMNDALMADDLVKQFQQDLFDSIRILQENHFAEVGKLLEALRIEAESVAKSEIDAIVSNMDQIWHQKRASAIAEIQQIVDLEKDKRMKALREKLQRECEKERQQKTKEIQRLIEKEQHEMKLRLQSEIEEDIQLSSEKERKHNAFRLKELETQLRRDSASHLETIHKEAKSAQSKQILALKSRHSKELQEKEKEIRKIALEELTVAKEQEDRRASAKAKSYENRLRKEIQEDNDRYLAKYRLEVQKEVSIQSDQVIKKFRRKLDNERLMACEKIKEEVQADHADNIANEKNVLQQRQILVMEEFKNSLLKEREEECARLRREHQASIDRDLQTLRAEFESAKSSWIEEIRVEAERDKQAAIAALKNKLEQERQQIVSSLAQEIIKRRQEALEAEQSAHRQEVERILSPDSIAILPATANDSADIVSRINSITSRVIHLQQQHKNAASISV